ncbi:hypothetical protein [Azospirillum sp. sgz302134]
MLRVKPAVMGLASCLLLVACSGEPAESDMRTLVEAHTRKALEGQGRGGFQGFEQFRKQGCVDAKVKPSGTAQAAAPQAAPASASSGSQYDCYYAATIPAQPGRPAVTVNGKGRFTRTDKGLQFEDLGAQPR